MALTRWASFWAAHKILYVSSLSFPHFNHWQLFPSSVLYVPLKNWSWRAFCFSSIRRCFLLFWLFWTFMNFSSFSSVVAAIIFFLLHLRTYNAKFYLSSLTSMLTSPLPPSILGKYNHSTFYLGRSPPYMVIIFLVYLIHFLHFFFHSFNNASTISNSRHHHVFIAKNICFEFNFDFNVALNKGLS